MSDLVFFDVETPNRRNDRISSISAIRMDDAGHELVRYSHIIDPEESFDPINIRLTGIDRDAVVGMPNFSSAWEGELETFFQDAVVVAHNARFDLSVISKALLYYEGISPVFQYLCTYQLSQMIFPELQRYSLNAVSDYLGIDLQHHHQSLDDAIACAQIFWTIRENFDCDLRPRLFGAKADAKEAGPFQFESAVTNDRTKAIQQFLLLVRSIESDGIVTLEEAVGLYDWMIDHLDILGEKLYLDLFSLLNASLEDGKIDATEQLTLNAALRALINPSDVGSEEIDITGTKFVLTGVFDFGSRSQVSEYITEHGGTVVSGVSKKVNYVVIGNRGSEAYAFGSYGTKVEKALELQRKGASIKVIHEDRLFGK